MLAQQDVGVLDADLRTRIVETVVTGHKYHQLSKRGSIIDSSPSRRSTANANNEQSADSSSSVSVTLNIAHRQNWNITIAPGAWARILTNVIGMCSHGRSPRRPHRHTDALVLQAMLSSIRRRAQ